MRGAIEVTPSRYREGVRGPSRGGRGPREAVPLHRGFVRTRVHSYFGNLAHRHREPNHAGNLHLHPDGIGFSAMLNLRWMRTHLARWVPERAKARFRARLFGYRGYVLEPGRLRLDAKHVEVSFRGLEFRAPLAAYDDLLYHVVDNGDSIEELDAVVRIARETGGTLLDVGAARGLISTVFCLAREGNRAVALEPSPVQVRDARAMAALNGLERRLDVRQVAGGREAAKVRGSVDEIGMIDFS